MEIWRKVLGFENSYLISNLGNIKSISRKIYKIDGTIHYTQKERILKTKMNSCGYKCLVIHLNGKKSLKFIHRMIAESFIQNPNNKPEVNHINGLKCDNRIENLEWVTSSENKKHAFDNGLRVSLKGHFHGGSKLSEHEVLEIRNRVSKNETNKDISEYYNVSESTIIDIKNKRSWKHL